MTKQAFHALVDRYKESGFTLAGVQIESLLQLAHDEIERAVAEGTSFEDFRAHVDEAFDAAGVTRRSDFHLRTVFQTNMAQSYGGGRWDEFHDPAVLEETAFFVYDAIDDDRTRPSHRAMDGFTAPPDDPIWDRWWPPNGFNCRCMIRRISKLVAAARGIKASTFGRPVDNPDFGFDGSPRTNSLPAA